MMKNSLALFSLFLWNAKLRLARDMAYRSDFFAGLCISLGLSSIGPIAQYLIFTQTKGYPGWNLNQIILFQGVLLFSIGLRDTTLGGVRELVQDLVRKGDFDQILLKPYPPIGVLLAGGFYPAGSGALIAGVVIMAYSIQQLNLSFSGKQILLFFISILCGLILSMAVAILYCCVVIIIIQMNRIGDLIDNLFKFSNYPVEIFPPLVRILFMTLLPFAVWVYLPAQALLNRWDLKALWGMIISLIFFWLSLKAWNAGLKKYTSAGG